MKLFVVLVVLVVASYAKYGVIDLYYDKCETLYGGFFGESSKCYQDRAGLTPKFAQMKCTSKHLILTSECEKNCSTCFKTTYYELDKCVPFVGGAYIKYSCRDSKPTIKNSGFYSNSYFNPQCKIENAQTNLNSFLYKGFCQNGNKKKILLHKELKDISKTQSMYMGYEKESNVIKQIRYAKQDCKGQIIEEKRSSLGYCLNVGVTPGMFYSIYSRK
eukprot:gene969-9876_t